MIDEKIIILDEFHWLKEDFEIGRTSKVRRRPVVRCVHNKRAYECTRGCRSTYMAIVNAHADELWRQEKEKLFIEKAKSVHTDGKYEYSNVHYVHANELVSITCLTCDDDFLQCPSNHMYGFGCNNCGNRESANKQRKTLETFVREANEVHENKYTYENFVYGNNNGIPGLITCPEHGDFPQTPDQHLRGHGCSTCGHQTTGDKKRKTLNVFVREANEVHENKYTYERFVYIDNHTNGLITCSEHGDFPQPPSSHLSGHGCHKCGDRAQGDKRRKTFDEFIREANEVHENKYTYDNFVYIDSHISGLITCPKHGDFPQKASNHLHLGHGCPLCKNQTEGLIYVKLKEKLESIGFKVEHMGQRVSEGVGRMDIRIVKDNFTIYVEIDGIHHFKDVPFHKSIVENVQAQDLKKHLCALAKGHHVIRIDQEWVWQSHKKRPKDDTWFIQLHSTIEKITGEEESVPGICEMFLGDKPDKYHDHLCYIQCQF